MSQSASTPFLYPRDCRVTHVERSSSDTVTLTMSRPTGYTTWHPGQFNMLYLFGLGEVPISICGGEEQEDHLVHTIRAVGAVTRALTELSVGDTVGIRGPFGSAWPSPTPDVAMILIAGGIGVAPLRSVVLNALHQRAPRQLALIYGARTPQDVLYPGDLIDWREAGVNVQVTVDRPSGIAEMPRDGARSAWQGAVGTVTDCLRRLPFDCRATRFLICGPEVMMRHVASDLAQRGVSAGQIYLSMERNMKCAIGICGRCQWGPHFLCRDGPVFRFDRVERFWNVKNF